jgi:hypothetical protein
VGQLSLMNGATKEFSNILYFLEDEPHQLRVLKKSKHKGKEKQLWVMNRVAKFTLNNHDLGESSQ